MDLHYCSTAVKRESLFYKSWIFESALLRAESKFDIVMGLPVEGRVFELSELVNFRVVFRDNFLGSRG